MKGDSTDRASVDSLPGAPRIARVLLPRKAAAPVRDDAALVRKPRARDVSKVQIVQSIIQRGIE